MEAGRRLGMETGRSRGEGCEGKGVVCRDRKVGGTSVWAGHVVGTSPYRGHFCAWEGAGGAVGVVGQQGH